MTFEEFEVGKHYYLNNKRKLFCSGKIYKIMNSKCDIICFSQGERKYVKSAKAVAKLNFKAI